MPGGESRGPTKVAIIGGGCAGLTAAFELTRPAHQGRFEVTVYQQGWRLGGKGASGRGVAGRIEEHGLHVWLGFYENAFRLVRQAYEELAEHPDGSPYGHWREAFLPESDIGIFASAESEDWRFWRTCFPPRPGMPGDPGPPSGQDMIGCYVAGALAMLRTLLLDTTTIREEAPVDQWPASLERLLDKGELAGAAAIAQALALIGLGLRSIDPERQSDRNKKLLFLAKSTAAALRTWVQKRFLADHPHRHIWLVAELVMASLVGTIRCRLIGHLEGFDAIDDKDSREWLLENGASEEAVRSPFMQGLYDLAMAYEDGDPARPRLAAGTALRGTIRMFFGYRGAMFWRMRAGMGDVVFAPLYECLRRRGVQFRFFHRLSDVALAEERDHIAALRFDEQVRTLRGGAYDPLMTVSGRPCWPAAPLWDQLERGAEMADAKLDLESDACTHVTGDIELKVGRDFDFAVLAVGVGAIPRVAPAILDHQPRWRAMIKRVKTVPTQALQLWLNCDLAALGWPFETSIAAGGAKPFDTFCDLAHVVPEEGWREANRETPATVIYFCGALADDPARNGAELEQAQQERVRSNALRFLDGSAATLWPHLTSDCAAKEAGAEGWGDAIYYRANVNASDRYTLTLPGATRWRISPLDMDYDNFTVAGDWTASGLNTGCTESAVMSGMLAAHSLSGLPRLEEITGYDHP